MARNPLRLRLDSDALVSNWRWLAARGGGAACGAAVKADGYGLGAPAVVERLTKAGCRDFFVSNWAEAASLEQWLGDVSLSVLHGAGPHDMEAALASSARPVLNSEEQVQRWRETGRPCDVMVDTGMNRLGLDPRAVGQGILGGLSIETLMSHLASADEDVDLNDRQRRVFAEVSGGVAAKRYSLSNSAAICLGPNYAFDLTRPGLALYGGIPRPEARGHIHPVVKVEARVVQRRRVEQGGAVGYNATFVAARPHEIAILNIGYADGYLRGFSGRGQALIGETLVPVIGRVSMDLTAICVDAAPHVAEGDWVELDHELEAAAIQSGLSQYELLTTLGARFDRIWN